MVSSILPAGVGAGAPSAEARFPRPSVPTGVKQDASANADRVDVSGPAAWAAARESVEGGLTQVRLALNLARDAQTMLLKVQTLVADPGSTQADLAGVLQDYDARFTAAASQGNALISGQSIHVQAEPGGVPLVVTGADLSLKSEPAPSDQLSFSRNASLGDRAVLAQRVQDSINQLQGLMEHLGEANRALEAHQGFLGAAQRSVSGVSDLNADGARLLALQVRQGLEAAGSGSIANVEPQAVLALFKV